MTHDPTTASARAVRFGVTTVAACITAGFVAALVPYAARAQALSDTILRASFCIGALEKGIELFAEPLPPLHVPRDGRGYTPPEDARQMQAMVDAQTRDFADKQQRLRRFVLPYMTNRELLLPLGSAQAEGSRVYQECNAAIGSAPGQALNSEVCTRVRPCFNLNWLPY